ncbi:MAG: site-specific recombinase, invertase Pin [Mucilaginibacter sp.]|nr:site-specific recombinase, invertase Pin [Mucilaginibacter sp.]
MGDLDATDYKAIKNESEHKIAILEAKLNEIPLMAVSPAETETLLDKAITKLIQLDVIYCNSDTNIQREIISSMHPEKFTLKTCNIEPPKLTFYSNLSCRLITRYG